MSVGVHKTVLSRSLLLGILFGLPAANAGDTVGRVGIVAVPEHGRPVVAQTDTEGSIPVLYDAQDGPSSGDAVAGIADERGHFVLFR